MSHLSHWTMFWACVIAVLSVARTTRLIVWDEYPPAVWVRMKWDDATHRSGWNKLMHCGFCASPYLMAGMAGWAYLSDLNAWWWWINGVWGLSYLAPIIVSYDQPD